MDNLNAPIYYGDSNTTVGDPFWIKCLWKEPIEWHKDGKPIQEHFVRHSKDEFSYSQNDVLKEKDIVESTLSVNHALLNHGGSYKCNINFANSHSLKIVGDKVEDEEDHLEPHEIFTPPEEFTTVVTKLKIFEENYEHTIDYDDIDSNEITTMTSITKHVSHMLEAVKSSTESTTTMSSKKHVIPDPTKYVLTTTLPKQINSTTINTSVVNSTKAMTHSTSIAPTAEMKIQQMILPKGSHYEQANPEFFLSSFDFFRILAFDLFERM